MKSKAVGWFEIYVNDMSRAKSFYEQVFGITLDKLETPDTSLEMWAFPGAMDDSPGEAGVSGALVKMTGMSAGAGGTIVYFACEDCANEAGRVTANGGTVMQEKFSIDQYGFAAMVADTEGNVIGLHSMQ